MNPYAPPEYAWEGTWSKVYREGSEERAVNEDLPLAWRIFFLAMSRANRIGHAEFASGELTKELSNREGKPSTPAALHKAIKTLISYGVLDPDSGLRCLVLPVDLVRSDEKGIGAECEYHHIYQPSRHRRV